MQILFFGDINGKIARRAMALAVPRYRQKYSPDLVVANVENAAHGAGLTEPVYQDLLGCGIDYFTSGNHIFDKGVIAAFDERPARVLRPANFQTTEPGSGFEELSINGTPVLLINLIGRVFMSGQYANPFTAFDEIIQTVKPQVPKIIFVDFHAEATSEKVAFGRYVARRASAVIGTHTHVPTADAQIIDKHTAYVSDVGMVGAKNSVIGIEVESALPVFLEGAGIKANLPEAGVVSVGAVLVDIDETTGAAQSIERVDTEIEV